MSEIAEAVRGAIAREKMIADTIALMPQPSVPTSIPPSIISAVAQGVQEFTQALIQSNAIDNQRGSLPDTANGKIPRLLGEPALLSDWATRVSLDELAEGVSKKVGNDWQILLSAWKAGIGAGMGSSLMNWGEQFFNTNQLVYAYGTLQYQISILPRMRRYWMREYTPTIPDTRIAWTLYTRGDITLDQFKMYASYEGWNTPNVELLTKALYKLPTDRTAFDMYLRGQLSLDDVHGKYYANAWKEEWHSKLDALFQSLPSAHEAFRLFKRGKINVAVKTYLYQASGYLPEWRGYLDRTFERLPSARDAFNMFMREAISEDDFDSYVEKDEWEDGSAARLWAIYQRLPYGRDAFRLFRRGKIDSATMTKLFKAQGYMPSYQAMLPNLYEHILSAREAFTLLMRGKLDKKQYSQLVNMNEWVDGADELLYSLFQRLPSYREAFYMWTKGIITLQKYHELLKASGFDDSWHMQLINNSYYIPTVYDLTRIADYVEVDTIWATKILSERGLRASDISKIVKMLKIRPLRDEIRRQIAIWVKRYRYGWITPTQLDAALQAYLERGYIQATEKDLTVEEAEINYEDELMQEKIDIYSWYYRTAVISAEDLLQDFLDLGIREEKANLMVELLQAQGYYGYY